MKILIATPSYDGSVRKEYMQSIMAVTAWMSDSGISWELLVEPATVLSVMRSVMASKALMDEGFTHLLFVDADMAFTVNAVRKLVEAKKPVVGCAYPYRTIPLDDAVEGPQTSIRALVSRSVPYAVSFPPELTSLTVKDGMCEVNSIGTGLLLISKEALSEMIRVAAVEPFRMTFPYNQWCKHPQYYGFFHHVTLDDVILGEDYSFCHLWRTQCHGTIFAVVDEEIFHIGPLPVIGRFLDRLKVGKR